MHEFGLSFALLIINKVNSLIELKNVEIKDVVTNDSATEPVQVVKLSGVELPEQALNFSLDYEKSLRSVSKLSRFIPNEFNNTQDYFINVINELLDEHHGNMTNGGDNKTSNLFKEAERLNNAHNGLLNDLNQYDEESDPVVQDVDYNIEESESSESNESYWVPARNTRRIYKGERTKIKYYPFMVTVHMFNTFMCAGSIIKSDLIITAASCLQLTWNNRFFRENPAYLSVRVGSNFYNNDGEVIQVLEVYFHPNYEPRTLHNNLAIMRLERKLYFKRRRKSKVKKIRFDRSENPLPDTTDGIEILGWGAKTASNKIMDPFINILSYAVLDIYPLYLCKEVYSKAYVSRTNFCAGFLSKGGGACNRDVGGPGVVDGVLVGVISFGSPACGATDAPTVFTKVGFYADWIEEIVNQPVHHSRVKTTLRTSTYHLTEATTVTTKRPKFPPIFPKKIKYTIPDTEYDSPSLLRNDNKNKQVLEAIKTLVKQDYVVVRKSTTLGNVQRTAGIPVDGAIEKTTEATQYEEIANKEIETEGKKLDNQIDSLLGELENEYNIKLYDTSYENLLKEQKEKDILGDHDKIIEKPTPAVQEENLKDSSTEDKNNVIAQNADNIPKFTAMSANFDIGRKDTNNENQVSKKLIKKIRNESKIAIEKHNNNVPDNNSKYIKQYERNDINTLEEENEKMNFMKEIISLLTTSDNKTKKDAVQNSVIDKDHEESFETDIDVDSSGNGLSIPM